MLYRNCRELPLHNFNECEVFQDYSYLAKNNPEKHSKEELLKKWEEIYAEYVELLDNDDTKIFFRDKMNLYLLSSKVKQIEGLKTAIELMTFLEKEKQEKIKEKISAIAKRLRIDNVEQALEIYTTRLQTKIIEFNNVYNKKKEKHSIDDMIPVLIKQGYPINRHTTTVSEYCKILNHIHKESKSKISTTTNHR